MCGDYRPLNLVITQDRYPMPIPEELFDSIRNSNIFTIVDMRQGFNQIVLVAKDHKKMAFHGSNKLWEWLVMPFGLKNAPVFFQRVMDQVLERADFLKCYINCRKPNLGLMIKARAYKRGRQEGGPEGTSYTPRSAGECEKMNPHTPKATSTWGVGVPMDSQIFREKLQGSKPIGLKSSLYHWKSIKT
jgi:hypothetical protein